MRARYVALIVAGLLLVTGLTGCSSSQRTGLVLADQAACVQVGKDVLVRLPLSSAPTEGKNTVRILDISDASSGRYSVAGARALPHAGNPDVLSRPTTTELRAMRATLSSGNWIDEHVLEKSKVNLDVLLVPRDEVSRHFESTARVVWFTGGEPTFYQDFAAHIDLAGGKCVATARAVVPPPRPTIPGDTA